ncbi:MAG: hypothetical protein FJ098_06805, partial [Deltaproteobacteria bacterium]|nr:hypothetical protein [Deltaproteobacteria bacterium]
PPDLGPADLVPELPPDLAQPDLAQEASAVAPDHGEGVPPDSVTDAESPDAGADRPPRDVRGEPAGGHRRPRDVTASPPEPIPSADADARPPEAPPADARPPEESANELFRLDRVRTEGEVKKTLFQLDPVPEGGRTP